MKIISNRSMQLGGQHIERAKPVQVSDADGALAIRMGWAVEAKPEPKAAKAEPKAAE